MKKEARHHLEILSEIERGQPITQRSLARILGVALGLTNLYLKRLANKGYIKLTTIPPRRIKYLVTPKGLAEKTRLTYEYLDYSLRLYRQMRASLRETLSPLVQNSRPRLLIYGNGEAAELVFLTLRELGLEPAGAVDGEEGTPGSLRLKPWPLESLAGQEFDLILVAVFGPADTAINTLIGRGVPREKIVTLRQ
jgi:DNA-binding MarR family transcriptional regulator